MLHLALGRTLPCSILLCRWLLRSVLETMAAPQNEPVGSGVQAALLSHRQVGSSPLPLLEGDAGLPMLAAQGQRLPNGRE